jgi:hypothetical protein
MGRFTRRKPPLICGLPNMTRLPTEAAPIQISLAFRLAGSCANRHLPHVGFGGGAVSIDSITNDSPGTCGMRLFGNSASLGRFVLNDVKLSAKRRRHQQNDSETNQQTFNHGVSPLLDCTE